MSLLSISHCGRPPIGIFRAADALRRDRYRDGAVRIDDLIATVRSSRAWLAHRVAFALGTPAAISFFALTRGLVGLHRLSRRAAAIQDPIWLEAAEREFRCFAVERPLALLVSDEVASPISWGIFRPVILIDRETLGRSTEADAIIGHEMAHVARFDWLHLLIGRVASALFWFNPLVLILARAARDYSEEAADAAAIARGLTVAAYAQVLVTLARRTSRCGFLPANCAVQSPLAKRIQALTLIASGKPRGSVKYLAVLAFVSIALPFIAASPKNPSKSMLLSKAPDRPGLSVSVSAKASSRSGLPLSDIETESGVDPISPGPAPAGPQHTPFRLERVVPFSGSTQEAVGVALTDPDLMRDSLEGALTGMEDPDMMRDAVEGAVSPP